MFKKDISFTQQEKAQLFTLDAKAFFQSYLEAFNFVK